MPTWPTITPSSTLAVGSALPASTVDALGQAEQTIGQAWQSYSPSLTNLTIGNGTVAGYYNQTGKTCDVWIKIAAGTTTTYSASTATVSLPATVSAVGDQLLLGRLYASPGNYSAQGQLPANATVANLLVTSTTAPYGLTALTSTGCYTPGTAGYLILHGRFWTA